MAGFAATVVDLAGRGDADANALVTEAVRRAEAGKGYWTRVRERLLADRITLTVMVLLACIVFMVMAAPLFATHDPYASSVFARLKSPGYNGHWLGTDGLGRDVAAGLIHGIRVSLTIGLVVVAIQALIGIVLGGLAGYYGGAADLALSRLFEAMLGIPTFFLIITVAAVFRPSIYLIMVILGLTGWVGIARLIRSEFLRVRSMDYVAAAQSLGASDARIMGRHILPNAIAPVLVSMSSTMSRCRAIIHCFNLTT